VTQGAVSQWIKRGRQAGESSLRRRPAPGAHARLTGAQRVELTTLLAHGAEAFGFLGDVWTSTCVAAIIHRHFGVRYHRAHVSRLLRALGFSVQRPIVRAVQRDEAVIQAWWDERWPNLKKKLCRKLGQSFG
jgi:transposase